MNRRTFIALLSVLPLVGILSCSNPVKPKTNQQIMTDKKGKSGTKATVSFVVKDKQGNVKRKGDTSAKIINNKKGD